jgi:hypothetical protein
MDLLNRFSSLQAHAAVGSVEGVNEGGRRETQVLPNLNFTVLN